MLNDVKFKGFQPLISSKVSERRSENKMDANNLAVFFGPILFWQPVNVKRSKSYKTSIPFIQEEIKLKVQIIQELLIHQGTLFGT